MSFARDGWDKLPKVGVYSWSQSSDGNVNLTIDGTSNACDTRFLDSYIKVNITEVKVVKDYGQEKRGYFSGEFEAILYKDLLCGLPSCIKRNVVTKGRFKLPMGGPTVPLNGTGTVVKADRMALLTAGKWYYDINSYGDCLSDDYFLFRPNGTFDVDDGVKKCAPGIADVKRILNNSWTFTNDQKTLHLKFNSPYLSITEEDFPIIELSETTLIFGDVTDPDSRLLFKHLP